MQADLHRLRPSKTATPDRNLLNHMAPDIDPSIRNARAGVRIQHRLGQRRPLPRVERVLLILDEVISAGPRQHERRDVQDGGPLAPEVLPGRDLRRDCKIGFIR
jgi:hypothetical protein